MQVYGNCMRVLYLVISKSLIGSFTLCLKNVFFTYHTIWIYPKSNHYLKQFISTHFLQLYLLFKLQNYPQRCLEIVYLPSDKSSLTEVNILRTRMKWAIQSSLVGKIDDNILIHAFYQFFVYIRLLFSLSHAICALSRDT